MIKTKTDFRLAEVGKIKIGKKGKKRKSQGGKEYRQPEKLDHFIVTTTVKDSDGNFVIDEVVMKKLGEKPTEIPIRLLFDDIDLNFFTSFQYYQGKKCVCRGDGESAERIYPEAGMKKIVCNPEECKHNQEKRCKISGILSCALTDSHEIGGVYRFRTHGWNSVSSILAVLQYFKANTNGILQGLPLKLKFLKKNTEDHGAVPMVTIVLDKIELNEMRQLAMTEAETRKRLGVNMQQIEHTAIDAGFKTDTDDPEDIEAEFFYEEDKVHKGTDSDDLEKTLEEKKTPVENKDQMNLSGKNNEKSPI